MMNNEKITVNNMVELRKRGAITLEEQKDFLTNYFYQCAVPARVRKEIGLELPRRDGALIPIPYEAMDAETLAAMMQAVSNAVSVCSAVFGKACANDRIPTIAELGWKIRAARMLHPPKRTGAACNAVLAAYARTTIQVSFSTLSTLALRYNLLLLNQEIRELPNRLTEIAEKTAKL